MLVSYGNQKWSTPTVISELSEVSRNVITIYLKRNDKNVASITLSIHMVGQTTLIGYQD
jgi:hypothetical protein